MARVAFAISVTILVGCSPDSTGSAAQVCNTLVDDAPQVSFMAMAGPAPAPTGGTISDGTYELSALTLYGATSAPSGQFSVVFEITGNTMQQVGHENGTERRYTSTFTISGTSISTDDSCPAADSSTHSLSATATEFRIYNDTASGTLEQTCVKRVR